MFGQIYEGDWNQVYMWGQKIGCCDCGLVHTVNFRKTRKGLEMQLFRDTKATYRRRQSKGLKIVHV